MLFVANFATEFSQGTFRTLLMRQPRRIGPVAGEMAALLVFVAGMLALAELLSVCVSLAFAPTQDISTGSWLSLVGLGDAASSYGTALVFVTAWATLGAGLAVVVRSVPIALGIGIAWSGPIEHLTMDLWGGAAHWFHGLLLEAFAVGGNADASASHALLVLAVYVAAATTAAALIFQRRDRARPRKTRRTSRAPGDPGRLIGPSGARVVRGAKGADPPRAHGEPRPSAAHPGFPA